MPRFKKHADDNITTCFVGGVLSAALVPVLSEVAERERSIGRVQPRGEPGRMGLLAGVVLVMRMPRPPGGLAAGGGFEPEARPW